MTNLVLSVGNDSTLLAIRKLMLTDAGYRVMSALGTREFVNKLFDGDLDVVVLCTSLAPVERRKMAALVRQHRPSTRIFALSAAEDGQINGADSTICGDTADLVRALAGVSSACAAAEGANGRVA